MANRLPIIAVIVAIGLFLIYSSIYVVNERQQAIVLRFGEIVDVEKEPGIYFKAPFSFFEADNVQIIDDRILRFDLDNIRVQVSGGKFYEVDAFVAFRISDPRVFRQAVSGSVPLAEQRLRTRLDAALRRVYGLRGFESALSEERAAMMREVRDQLRPDATSLGLEIVDVRILRTDLTAEVSQQTYDRMKAERLAEAERLRARGREAAQRIRARADREVVEIVAEARKESEILRGEGEAERNAVFADAFKRDPGFFEFYRSMSAYEAALKDSGTTMVLSPDSDFFRYFRSPRGAAGTPAAVAPAAAAPAPAAFATEPAPAAPAPAAAEGAGAGSTGAAPEASAAETAPAAAAPAQ
jgi:membrane protease subunit HflC